jgi:hypothetical protein
MNEGTGSRVPDFRLFSGRPNIKLHHFLQRIELLGCHELQRLSVIETRIGGHALRVHRNPFRKKRDRIRPPEDMRVFMHDKPETRGSPFMNIENPSFGHEPLPPLMRVEYLLIVSPEVHDEHSLALERDTPEQCSDKPLCFPVDACNAIQFLLGTFFFPGMERNICSLHRAEGAFDPEMDF